MLFSVVREPGKLVLNGVYTQINLLMTDATVVLDAKPCSIEDDSTIKIFCANKRLTDTTIPESLKSLPQGNVTHM